MTTLEAIAIIHEMRTGADALVRDRDRLAALAIAEEIMRRTLNVRQREIAEEKKPTTSLPPAP